MALGSFSLVDQPQTQNSLAIRRQKKGILLHKLEPLSNKLGNVPLSLPEPEEEK